MAEAGVVRRRRAETQFEKIFIWFSIFEGSYAEGRIV